MKTYLKIISSILVLFIYLSIIYVGAFAKNNLIVKIECTNLDNTTYTRTLSFDVPPQEIKGRVMVPLRGILESLNIKFEWNDNTQTITCYKDNTKVDITVDNPKATINGKELSLDVPPQIINNRILIPLRFISEAFGEIVTYDNGIITIKSQDTPIQLSNIKNNKILSNPFYMGYINGGTFSVKPVHSADIGNYTLVYKDITSIPQIRCISTLDGSNNIINNTGAIKDYIATNSGIFYTSISNYAKYTPTDSLNKISQDGNSKKELINGNTSILYADDNWVYYIDYKDNSKLYKMKHDGSNISKITDKWKSQNYYNISFCGDYIFYRDNTDSGRLYSIKNDGTYQKKVMDEILFHYTVDKNYIYFVGENNKDDNLYRIRYDGSEKVKLADKQLIPLKVADNWIYVDHWDDSKKLYKIYIDGSKLTKLTDEQIGSSLFINGDNIYYSDVKDNNSLYKMSTDGTGKVKVIQGKDYQVVGNSIYYIDEGLDRHLYIANKGFNSYTQLCNDNMKNIAIIDEWVYYSNYDDSNKLYKIKLDGTLRQKISNDNLVYGFQIDGDYIYYNGYDIGFTRIKTDGTDKKIIKSGVHIFSPTVKDGVIYFGNNYTDRDGSLRKINYDGTGEIKLNNDKIYDYGTQAIFLYQDWIYYITYDKKFKLYRTKLDGSERTLVLDQYPINFYFYNGMIYFQNGSDDFKLYKMKLDGSDVTKLSDNVYKDIQYYDGWIYFKKRANNTCLYKMKLDCTSEIKLNDDRVDTYSIADNWLYYKDYDGINFYKVSIDGAVKELIK